MINNKERKLPCKPEWKIILEHLVYQDETMLYRICRKLIITLDRRNVWEIHKLMEELNPTVNTDSISQVQSNNWPKPKGSPFVPADLTERLFGIADKYMPDDDLTQLLSDWIQQENVSFITNVLEKRHAPLSEVVDAVQRFFRIIKNKEVLSENERVGLRVALILRFLSENLAYTNIAKDYISFESIEEILGHIVGPAQGNGKLGGKAAGLILAYQILQHKKKEYPLLENVHTPKSWFVTSDGILEFIHYNALEELVFAKYMPSEDLKQEYGFTEYIFKNSHFPPESVYAFSSILDDLEGRPIVVRSSSLLEDSFEASFSGKYKSLFLANTGSKDERMAALMNAIAEVYASTFGPDPIEYRRERSLLYYKEEMAILVQEVVGTKIGKHFLPSFAGVAFSHNEFRWSQRIKRSDGIIRLVAGLGTRAVDRTINDYPTLISPGQPGIKVNQSYEDMIRYSQQNIDVINLETNSFETIPFSQLIGESGGDYPGLQKIVSFNRAGTLVQPVSEFVDFASEDLIITFHNLIDNTKFVEQINLILKELHKAFSAPIDVEFASDGEKLYLLQCRPQSRYDKDSRIRIPASIPRTSKLFTANQFVSNGLVEGIEYAVYVDPYNYSQLSTAEEMAEIGRIVGLLNKRLPRHKFILIGPGRWGSKGDIKLGVPVIYSDINNTAMLIEVAREQSGYVPELSFGTHFFQDLVEANIRYLPLYPDRDDNLFNEEFFNQTSNCLGEFYDESQKGSDKFYDTMGSSISETIKVIRVRDFSAAGTISIYMDGEEQLAVAFIKSPNMALNVQ